jgi:hypothetical protein
MDAAKQVEEFIKANPGTRAAIFVDTLMRNMTGDPFKPQDMMRLTATAQSVFRHFAQNTTGQ